MFRMPQLYVLHGNRTCNPLATRDLSIEEIEIESDLSDSSMKYACMVLGEAGRRLLQSDDELRGRRAAHLAAENFNEVLSSLHAACALLCNRWMMLELRRQLQEESVSLYRGVAAEALRAKLALVEDRMHKASDGLAADEVLQQWLNDFDTPLGKVVLSTTANSVASAEFCADREAKDREQRWLTRNKKDEEGKRGGKSAKARAPGTNKWKLALDFRGLKIFCVMSQVKTETLKKLRRPNDWCFSFALEDGFQALGIDRDFQHFMQFAR
eukprot:gene34534-biopygen32866